VPDQRNFILGHGEKLIEPTAYSPHGRSPEMPYTVKEAVERLSPRIKRVSEEISRIPAGACPKNEAVAVMTLHPRMIAKSYYPVSLLSASGLRAVGSRPATTKPEKWTRDKKPKMSHTTELFVAGKRPAFTELAKALDQVAEEPNWLEDLQKIEDFQSFSPGERLRPQRSHRTEPVMEVVLHAPDGSKFAYILNGFVRYLKDLGLKVDLERRIHAGGLCFLSVSVPRRLLADVEKFSFLRVAREMPMLRSFEPIFRSLPAAQPFEYSLPDGNAHDPKLRVAIFDGGAIDQPELKNWVRRKKCKGVGEPILKAQEHGSAVTSALLFGHISKGAILERPYSTVDVWRVLGAKTKSDMDLLDVLARIDRVLQKNEYDFVNVSMGPELPIEDTEVHAWTAVLDQHLSNGKTLAAIAAGNGGEYDQASGNARVQTPADCVNSMAVGACDRVDGAWDRASYSSVGPGRSPGIVKPDLVAFGGSDSVPFCALDPSSPGAVRFMMGTSFASPVVLRTAIGLRAHLGPEVTPLAAKTLLIHRTVRRDGQSQEEVGWGRPPDSAEALMLCPERGVTILYCGHLDSSSRYQRARIPLPSGTMEGYVTITATFCIAAQTDPQDPANYTRAGLNIHLRPHKDKRKKPANLNADTVSFFRPAEPYLSEQELRTAASKWETVRHAKKRFRASSLRDPVFDIHYMARESGHTASRPTRVPYALVVTVEAPRVPNIYNRVLRRYRAQLEVLRPVIEVPIRVQ